MMRMLDVRAVAAAIMTLTLSWLCLGQEPGGQQAPPPQQQPGGGQQGGGAGRQPGNQPTFPDRGIQQQVPEISRPIYLSGSVRLSDGTVPPANVVIERVCNGVIRPEAYTDSKGNFSFMVGGQNSAVFADASVSAPTFYGCSGIRSSLVFAAPSMIPRSASFICSGSRRSKATRSVSRLRLHQRT